MEHGTGMSREPAGRNACATCDIKTEWSAVQAASALASPKFNRFVHLRLGIEAT
jgi:hypothetical protein